VDLEYFPRLFYHIGSLFRYGKVNQEASGHTIEFHTSVFFERHAANRLDAPSILWDAGSMAGCFDTGIEPGAKLRVIGKKGRWVQVTHSSTSKSGWIYAGNVAALR